MPVYRHEPVFHPDTRDSRLPRFTKYDRTHPLWTHGTAYVYEWDTNPKAQATFRKFVHDRKVIGCVEEDLEKEGEMWLKPKEAVFARHLGRYYILYL